MKKARNQQVSDFLACFRMVDLLGHFIQRLMFQLKQMWWQVHRSKILCSQCNYILGLDRRLINKVGIRYLRKFSSNHFDLRARLL